MGDVQAIIVLKYILVSLTIVTSVTWTVLISAARSVDDSAV